MRLEVAPSDPMVSSRKKKRPSSFADYSEDGGKEEEEEEDPNPSKRLKVKINLSAKKGKDVVAAPKQSVPSFEELDEDDVAVVHEESFDFSKLALKPDHSNRPVWVTPDRRIFLESFSPLYRQVST